MKYLLFLTLLFSGHMVFAEQECKTTTVTIERNGAVNRETATVCKEGEHVDAKVKIGDVILESEVGEANLKKYFNYRNSKCRMFSEHLAIDKSLHVYYGVICQIDSNGANWIVVDKW